MAFVTSMAPARGGRIVTARRAGLAKELVGYDARSGALFILRGATMLNTRAKLIAELSDVVP